MGVDYLQERERSDLQEDIPSSIKSIHDLRQLYYNAKLGFTTGVRSDTRLVRAWLISQTGLPNITSTRDLWVAYMVANGVTYRPSLGDMMKQFFGAVDTASGGNPGTSTPTLQTASGSFTGSGVGRSITGLGFQPDLVIIHNDSATASMRTSWKISEMGTKTASFVGSIANFEQGIISLDADGFTLGTDNNVNENTKTIYWKAFKDNGSGSLAKGTYAGNGTSKVITGLGFSPNAVFVKMDSTSARGCWKPSTLAGDNTLAFENVAAFAGGITSFDADGFTTGNSARVNTNAANYFYFACKEVAGIFDVGSYTTSGSVSDNRSIQGVGFQPSMLIIKVNSTENASLRMPGNVGDLSYASMGGASSANIIQAFESDGFQLGTGNTVQVASQTFYYAAFK